MDHEVREGNVLCQRRPSQRRFKYAAITILLGALSGYSGVLPIFRDTLQSYFGVSVSQFGLLFSIGAIPGSLTALAAGIMIDRWGPRAVLRACFAGIGIGMCLAAQGKQWIVMLAAVTVIACFASPLNIAIQSYLVNLFPRHRRRILSLNMVTIGIRGILFSLWAEYLLHLQRIHSGLKFEHVLHLPFAAFAVPTFLGIFLYRKEKTLGQVKPPMKAQSKWFQILLSPSSMSLVSLLVMHGTVDSAAGIWMPMVLGGKSFSEHIFAPGIVMAARSLAYVLSRGALVLLPEQVGSRVMLIAPGILGGMAFLAGILSRSQPITATGYVLGSFLWSLEYPAILTMLSVHEHRRFGSAMAIQAIAGGALAFLVINLMGLIGARLGEQQLWKILIIPALGFPLIGIGGAIWLLQYGSRKTGPKDTRLQ